MGARVRLLAKDFDPRADTVYAEALTGARGDYTLSDIAPGHYNLEAYEATRGHFDLVQDIKLPASGISHADGMLSAPGKLAVRISDFARSGDSGYLYMPGTGAFVSLGADAIASGEINLDRIPAGRFDSLMLVLRSDGGHRKVALARNLEITPGDLTTVNPLETWAYSRSLPLDTKSMGLTQDVIDFPLLVRLTADDSVFDQASSSGVDLRFANAAGHALPFQVERWDVAKRQAEIWVRIDTVRANATDQGIRMFWGKPDAKPSEDEQTVFDPEAGFATVYHLAESPISELGGYKDATPLGNHVTAASLDPASQVNGVIGLAKSFSGTPTSADRALTAALPQGFAGNSSFTVSFWMRCRMAPQRQGILDFGTYGLQQNMHFLLLPDTTIQFGAYNENPSGAGPASWQSTIKVTQAPERWTHFTTVYDAAQGSLKVYVNGARVDSLNVPAMAIGASGGLRIGKPIGTAIQPPVEYPFNGELDEVRFVNRVLSPERILLDYATQRP